MFSYITPDKADIPKLYIFKTAGEINRIAEYVSKHAKALNDDDIKIR